MDKIVQVLAILFYLIWIPLGILLMAGVMFMIVANPIGRIMESLPGGGFSEQGGPPGGFSGPRGGFGQEDGISQSSNTPTQPGNVSPSQ